MKKAFLFIVLLTTLIINSKTIDDHELNQFIDTLKQQTALLHQQRMVLIILKNRLTPLNLHLSPIPQFNAEALKLLPTQQRHEIAMRIDQDVQNRREFYRLTSEYLERVQRQSDPVESSL